MARVDDLRTGTQLPGESPCASILVHGQLPARSRGNLPDLDGLPKVLLPHNLKSALRRGDVILFHPTLLNFAIHYRFEPLSVTVP